MDIFSKKPAIVKESSNKFIYEKTDDIKTVFFKSIIGQEDEKYVKNIKEKLGEPHPINFETMGEIYSKFGVVSAIIDKIIDFAIGPGIYIKCEDDGAKKILEDFIEDNQLTGIIKQWLRDALIKGNGFVELAGVTQEGKGIALKNINANSMYVRRDKKGKILGYTQHTGDSYTRIKEDDAITFKAYEIMHLPHNIMPGDAYGLGKIYPAEQIIVNFLTTQKALHYLVKRKSNNPVHAIMGNAEKNDYPSQAQIDDFAKSLQVMNEKTEWVTGPNIEIKGIDFGNFTEKFKDVLENDYQNLSIAMQVPQVIMGKANVSQGIATVDLDVFERMIKSIQEAIEKILEEQLLKKVLVKNAIEKKDGKVIRFDIEWGEQNLKDKLEIVQKLTELIKNPFVSNIMRISVEKQIAELLELDIENEIDAEEEDRKKKEEEFAKQDGLTPGQKAERDKEEKQSLPNVPGQNSQEQVKGMYKELLDKNIHHHGFNEIKEKEDMSIQEWVDFNLEDLRHEIIKVIELDDFKNLRALTKTEIAAGYLNKRNIGKLREVMKKGFGANLSVKQVEKMLLKDKVIGNLYAHTKNSVDKSKILIEGKRRANIVTRTETVRLANLGALETYKTKNVEKIRWLAAMSDRTCPQCAELNGKVMDAKNPEIVPPAHVMCFIDGQIQVYSLKGWKQIKDIKVNDLVLTHEGRFMPVNSIIDDMQYDGEVFSVYWDKDTHLTMTPEHPILTEKRGWIKVKDLSSKDRLIFLAKRCKECNELIIDDKNSSDFCSLSCANRFTANEQFKDDWQHKIRSIKAKEQMKREYETGVRDRYKITEKANEKTREMVDNREHQWQSENRTFDNWNKGLTKENHDSLMKISKMRTGSGNPMHKSKHTEDFWENISQSKKQFYKEHPEKHPNYIMGQKGFISSSQKEVFNIVKEHFENAESEYPIITEKSTRFADVAIPSLKIDIEYDGEYWHKDKEKDKQRDDELRAIGWSTIRVNEKNKNNILMYIEHLLQNHNNEFEFISVPIYQIKRFKLKKARKLYNFSVEEDESYIAKGMVTHNCRCTTIPVVELK